MYHVTQNQGKKNNEFTFNANLAKLHEVIILVHQHVVFNHLCLYSCCTIIPTIQGIVFY